jgi:hypothetical protein
MTYLRTSELAELVGCRPNQKSRMIAWLTKHGWRYVIDTTGTPKVARLYHDRKMGICDNKQQDDHADGPNLNAFSEGKNRR